MPSRSAAAAATNCRPTASAAPGAIEGVSATMTASRMTIAGCSRNSGTRPAATWPRPCSVACRRRANARSGTNAAATRIARIASVPVGASDKAASRPGRNRGDGGCAEDDDEPTAQQPLRMRPVAEGLEGGELSHHEPVETDRGGYREDRDQSHRQRIGTIGLGVQEPCEHQQREKLQSDRGDTDREGSPRVIRQAGEQLPYEPSRRNATTKRVDHGRE